MLKRLIKAHRQYRRRYRKACDRGRLQVWENVGFTDKQISVLLNVSLFKWLVVKGKLEKRGEIIVFPDNVIEIVSLHKRSASPAYKKWRRKVFERDNYICQNCRKRGGYLEAHHKEQWKDNPRKRYEVDNGETLCKKCHKKYHKRRKN